MLGLAPKTRASKFIKMGPGRQTLDWDEATDPERYKLGDIYHSSLVEIRQDQIKLNPHGLLDI